MKTVRQQFIDKFGIKEYYAVHYRMRKCFQQLGINTKGKDCHCDAKTVDDYFFFYRYKLLSKKEHRNIPEHIQSNSEGQKGKKMPEEVKKKISKAHKGEKNYFYGKHHTPEAIEKIRKAAIGRKSANKGKRNYDLKTRI